MKHLTSIPLVLAFLLTSCNLPINAPAESASTETGLPPTMPPAALTEAISTMFSSDTALTAVALLSASTAEALFFTAPAPPTPTATPTSTTTPVPIVESLDATVTADLLSCRYGPGAEYLYLYGLKKGANIQLIGRTDGNNWVMVKGKNLCWINARFVEIKGDPQTLRVAYPGEFKLPVSPYYSPPTVLKAVRDPNNKSKVTVEWSEMTLRPGDEEDENMFIYIIEVWRCEGGKTIFDPLASNYPEVTFVDEPGCSIPSHGRVFFQEKHGFAGPAEIVPWPEY